MNDIANRLNQHYSDQNLAHFYHLKCSPTKQDDSLSIWLTTWLQKLGIKNPRDHSDVLWIPDQVEQQKYLVSDIQEIFRFNEYRPLSLKYKFIVIANAAKLAPIVANKLLKILEEPTPQTSIFLLNPSSCQLLETISSRAINLNIPLAATENADSLLPEIQTEIENGLTLHQFIQKYKKTANIDSVLLKAILSSSLKAKTPELIDLIKDLEQARTYHSTIGNRLTRIYYFFK